MEICRDFPNVLIVNGHVRALEFVRNTARVCLSPEAHVLQCNGDVDEPALGKQSAVGSYRKAKLLFGALVATTCEADRFVEAQKTHLDCFFMCHFLIRKVYLRLVKAGGALVWREFFVSHRDANNSVLMSWDSVIKTD
tara:strand:- start:2110 stop:2523 length:414 start_codon:yes stop_codon:yes gene_type:complete